MSKPQAWCSFSQQLHNIIGLLSLISMQGEIQKWQMQLMRPTTRPCQFGHFYNMTQIHLKDVLMIKSPQPSVGVMKCLAQTEDLDDLSLSTGSICWAFCGVKATTFSSPDGHQQPYNHPNLICYIHKSHAGLDSWGFANRAHHMLPRCTRTHGVVNKDKEIN